MFIGFVWSIWPTNFGQSVALLLGQWCPKVLCPAEQVRRPERFVLLLSRIPVFKERIYGKEVTSHFRKFGLCNFVVPRYENPFGASAGYMVEEERPQSDNHIRSWAEHSLQIFFARFSFVPSSQAWQKITRRIWNTGTSHVRIQKGYAMDNQTFESLHGTPLHHPQELLS